MVYRGGMGETMLVVTGSTINKGDICRINPIDKKVYPIDGSFVDDTDYSLYCESFLQENETAIIVGNKVYKQVQG